LANGHQSLANGHQNNWIVINIIFLLIFQIML
jgi:uncharacterized membrane protein